MTDHFLCYLTAVCLAVALAVAGAEVLDHLQARDAAHADCRAELDAERAVGWAPEEARKQLDLVEAALSRTDLGRGGVGPEVVALLRKKLAGASIATGLGNAGQAFELIDEARALLGDEKGGVK